MKPTTAVLLLLFASAFPAAAADFDVGYRSWDYDVSGIVENDGDRIDLERDLAVQTRSKDSFDLRWDTGSGWVPDLAASWLQIDAGGRREVTSGGTPGPLPVPPTTTVVLADADLDDYDLALRYPATLGAGTVWGGVAIKRLDGTIVTRDEEDTRESTENVDEWVPLLHLAGEWPLGQRVVLGGRSNWMSYDGSEAFELRLLAEVRVWGALTLSAGWQRKQYQIRTANFLLDATLDGALLGIGARFR